MTEIAGERMLLHELNHRINNEFAAAISTVSLAARRSNIDEVKAVLSGVVELLHGYADVHRAADARVRHAGRCSDIPSPTLPFGYAIPA
jgi:two-component sensor histidine kinase